MPVLDLLAHWFRRGGIPGAKRQRRLQLDQLEDRTTPTAAINLVANSFDVPAGRTELIPLSLASPTVSAVTYSATSSSSQVTTQVVTSTQTLVLTVNGKDATGAAFSGDLKIELFGNESPLAVGRIVALTNSGFYNNMSFHRVLQTFVAQAGDPVNGNGTGGSTLGTFSDEFASDLTFNSPGVVAFANAGHDTNDSQFFITALGLPLAQDPQFLNFKYDLFGQLVSGFSTFNSLMSTPVTFNSSGEQSSPLTKVMVTNAQIINDPTVAVLRVSAASGFQGSSTLNISADDGSGPSSAQATVNYVPATVNNPAFLGSIKNQTTELNTPIITQLTATDVEGDPLSVVVRDGGNFANAPQNVTTSINPANGQLTITPNAGFTGTTTLYVGVRDQTARGGKPLDDQSQFDTQKITVTVLPTVSGTGQAAALNTAFTNPLVVTVLDASGAPLSGVTVSFAAPASGAGVTFSGGNTAVTNAQGVASKNVSANSFTGSYTLTAFANGVAYTLTLTNAPGAGQPPVVGPLTAQTVADGSTLSFTALAASEIINGSPTPVTFSLGAGAPAGATLNAQTGAFSWTPSQANGVAPGVFQFTISAAENVNPALVGSATQTITVGPSSTNQGTKGVTARQTVAVGLTQSAEYYSNIIRAAYNKYLGRPPEASGLAYWLDLMQNHALSDEHLESGFIGSKEYIDNHGGTGQNWLTGLYQDLLGRNPAQSEVQYWLDQLNSGKMTSTDVAFGFAASQERETERVQGDYLQYLGRAASATELPYWVNVFLAGASNEVVNAGFVGSQEYFQNHGNNIVDWLYASYKTVLNRLPDTTGYQYWFNQL